MEEIWKDIFGYEGFYKISNFGRVRSVSRMTASRPMIGRILSSKINVKHKYEKVSLYGKEKPKTYAIHTLVANHFLEKPNDGKIYEVNHIDGNMYNNHFANLEWVTHYDNMQHKNKLGTVLLGEKHQNTKYKESQIIEVKKLIREGLRNIEITKKTGVSSHNISAIKAGKSWKHINI